MNNNGLPTFDPSALTGQQNYQSAGANQQFNNNGSNNPLAALASTQRLTTVGNRGSKTPKEVLEIFDKLREDVQDKFKVFSLVIEDHQLRIPAVAFYIVDANAIYAMPLLLEECGQPLPLISEQTQYGSIEVDNPTIRYWNATMASISHVKIVEDAMRRGLVNSKAEITTIMGTVIPRTVTITDENSLRAFYDAVRAAFAAQVAVNAKVPTSGVRSAMLTNSGLQVVARNKVRPGETVRNIYGAAIASDFQIDLIARSAIRNQNDIHGTSTEYILASVNAYVDFAYRAPDQAMIYQAAASRMPVPGFDPYIVITSNSPLGVAAQANDDILSQCFGLAAITGIAGGGSLAGGGGGRWASVFTRGGGDKGSKASIGALGLLHNQFPDPTVSWTPTMIPVSAGFEVMSKDVVSPLTVIQQFCTNSMVVAMDIEQGGPLAWLQSIFANATPNSVCEQLILDELDAFSNGLFTGKIWDRRNPIIAQPHVDIHMGYYTENNGNIRDIRSIDLLTITQQTNGDPQIIGPYLDSFKPNQCNKVSLNARRNTIKTFASNTVFTGMATRVFFNTKFINALDQMFAECGMRITLDGLNDIQSNNYQSTAFDQQYVAPIQGHGTFHQNFSMTNSQPTVNYFQNSGLGYRVI